MSKISQLEMFETVFYEKHPEFSNLIKKSRVFSNESLTDNVFLKDENGLLIPVEKGMLDSLLRTCLYEVDVTEINRQKNLIKTFLSKFEKFESNFDRDGDNYFVGKNFAVDLTKLIQKKYPKIPDMLKDINLWDVPQQSLQANLITRYSEIKLPSSIENFVVESTVKRIKEILLRCMGNQEDSVENFLDYISAALYGIRKADYFLILQGVGGTGKNLILDFLQLIFGNYFTTIEADDLLNEKPSVKQKLYYRKSARIISIQEPSENKKKVSLLKRITGRGKIQVEGKEFTMSSLFLIDSNFPVEPSAEDSGFDRRCYILPFGPKIPEEEQNRELLVELKDLAPYFLLELLRRFSCIEIEKIQQPKITETVQYWNHIERNGKFVQAFMDICCTADVETGKEIALKDIREEFQTHFPAIYSEYRKNYLFWFDGNKFEEIIQKTTAQEFNAIFLSRYKNHGLRNGYPTIRHLVVGNPGEFQTMEKRQIQDLVKRFHIDEDEAKARIDSAREPSVAKARPNPLEEDYRELLSYVGLWGLHFFRIFDGNPRGWKNAVINYLCRTNLQSLNSFRCDFVIKFVSHSETERLCEILRQRFSEKILFPEDCVSDVEINDVLDEIFDAFAKGVRENLANRNLLSPMNPQFQISQMNLGISPTSLNLLFPQPFGNSSPMGLFPPVQQSAAGNMNGTSTAKLILGKKN